MDRARYVCTQCNGPRSRRSKGLCLDCYSHRLVPDCTHHWVFDTPKGQYSLGVCKLCGERRKGSNSITQEYGSPIGKAALRGPGQKELKVGRIKYYANAKQKVMR